MNYRISTFYKRDIDFVYNEELNNIEWITLRSGNILKTDQYLIYTVDRIDSYIDEYDLLPTIGIPLVSQKWVNEFKYLENKEIQFIPVIIKDKFKNRDVNFYALNILNTLPCLNKEKSVFEIDEDGDYNIKLFFINSESLKKYSIIRMKEHRSYIIVTEKFKKRCEDAGLKGIYFVEEGHSIYN